MSTIPSAPAPVDDGTPEAAYDRLRAALARRSLRAEVVPYGADRYARPGEVCTCGAPAAVVYLNRQADGTERPVPFCGVSRV